MKARFEFLALFGVTEYFVCNPAALILRHKLVNNVIGIKRLDTKIVKIFCEKRLPAGNSTRKSYSHFLSIPFLFPTPPITQSSNLQITQSQILQSQICH